MEEQWKPLYFINNKKIYDFSQLYLISNTGKIYSIKNGRIIKQTPSNGYLAVMLKKDKKAYNFRVHRLVALVYVPNPHNFPVVNHKDENKYNNNAENLEWCTQHYNVNYGTGIKRMKEKRKGHRNTPEQNEKIAEAFKKKVICLETGQIFNSMQEAAKWCGLKGASSIGECCSGKVKSAGKHPVTKEKLHWKYCN